MNMGNFVAIGKTGELKDGEKKKVGAGGHEIMLARAGGKYYAIANRCPHMGGDLSMGGGNGRQQQCHLHLTDKQQPRSCHICPQYFRTSDIELHSA